MKNAKANIVTTNDLKDLLFPVEKIKTEFITEMPANSNCEYTILAKPEKDKSKIQLATCSERYELVPVAEFAPTIRQIIINHKYKFTEKYTIRDNAVFYGEIVITDKDFYIGDNPNDTLQMKIMWAHSYNGMETYELNMGTFNRVKCSNGLWMTIFDTKKYGLSIKGKHTAKIQYSLEALTNKLEEVLKGDVKKKIKETFTPLYDHWVENWEDRLKEVLQKSNIGSQAANVEHISNIIRSESSELYGGRVNDWLIYNGINNFLFDDKKNVKLNSARVMLDNKVLQTIQATIN